MTKRSLSIQRHINKLPLYALVLFIVLIFTHCSKEDDQSSAKPKTQNEIYYQTFNVDTTNFDNDTINYDVNGDSILELQLTKYINTDSSSSANIHYSGTIECIEDSMVFCYIRTEPNWTMLELGYEIYHTNIYNWQSLIVYSGSTPYISAQHYWAYNVFTDYIGFKLIKGNNNYFGWFRLKHFRVAEIAINNIPNSSIIVGQKK